MALSLNLLIWLWTVVFLILCRRVFAGHEVLEAVNPSHVLISPKDIAIVQFDNRDLDNYWNISARWNRAYCDEHGHQYLYLTMRESCRSASGDDLASPWCKVKAMIHALEAAPSAKAFIYLDSDALLTVNHSMSVILSFIHADLHWDWDKKPIAFNQDGPGWACKLAFKLQYKVCFNSGTVVWMRSSKAEEVLRAWWASAGHELRSIPFRMNWKLRWPWEQAQQYSIFNRFKDSIQVLSFPDQAFLPWTSTKNPKSQYPTDTIEPWCLSHWLGANCFITHFCASSRQKQKMRREYDIISDHRPITATIIPPDDVT